MQFENLLVELIKSDEKNKEAKALSMAVYKMVNSKGMTIDKEFVDTWFDFAKEDVERRKTTWEEVVIATYKYTKYLSDYPVYANIWTVIRAMRDERPKFNNKALEKENPLSEKEKLENKRKSSEMIKKVIRKKRMRGKYDI